MVYLLARNRGYAREIARFFGSSLYPVQKALDGLEAAGVLVSRSIGTTREYELNPIYPGAAELRAFVARALSLYPADLRERLTVYRSRPRRKGKPV